MKKFIFQPIFSIFHSNNSRIESRNFSSHWIFVKMRNVSDSRIIPKIMRELSILTLFHARVNLTHLTSKLIQEWSQSLVQMTQNTVFYSGPVLMLSTSGRGTRLQLVFARPIASTSTTHRLSSVWACPSVPRNRARITSLAPMWNNILFFHWIVNGSNFHFLPWRNIFFHWNEFLF